MQMIPHTTAGEISPIRVFTDGSCVGNGKASAVAGIGVHFPDGQAPNIGLPYKGRFLIVDFYTGTLIGETGDGHRATNQRAELEAIRIAIELSTQIVGYIPKDVHIHVYTDSSYAIDALTVWIYNWEKNDWKTAHGRPVKNRDLMEAICKLMRQNRVVFFHSPAHTSQTDYRSRGNAVADDLAQKASLSQLSGDEKKLRSRGGRKK